jgi:hypothetical protein
VDNAPPPAELVRAPWRAQFAADPSDQSPLFSICSPRRTRS